MFGKKKEAEAPRATARTEDPAMKPAAKVETPAVLRPQPAMAASELPRKTPDLPPAGARRVEKPAETKSDQRSEGAGEVKKLIVGRDIFLSGEIKSCNKLVVEGSVEAALRDCQTVEIAEAGLFRGSAEIDTADVSGRFEGDLTVRSRLIIRSTGRIVGTVRYGQIEIERGGVISGQIEHMANGNAASASTSQARDMVQSASGSSWSLLEEKSAATAERA
ncbi:MAG TPA: polymer-forming cytoskeletal protein [Alphaproteobacteria bacterium]|jgi:cytoskeletal protein CcmA (bactofilin family)|nr:polymer-forming cytoskeletal protein [Alphaproteobacteria bacterium]